MPMADKKIRFEARVASATLPLGFDTTGGCRPI